MSSSILVMAGPGDRDDGDAGVVLDTRTKTQRPPLYKVMLLNDDYTPMEFVVMVLKRFFGMDLEQATRVIRRNQPERMSGWPT